MGLNIGLTPILNVQVGATPVQEVYIGSTLLWQRAYAPIVITQPVAFSGANGSTATYTCAFDADPVATYQWYDELGNLISGATTTTLSFVTDYLSHNGKSYKCRATNSQGTAETVLALCTVALPAAPVVSLNPVGATITEGAVHAMTAGFTGVYGTPIYQWYQFNGTTYTPVGTNSTSYSYTGVVADPLGTSFFCRCTDAAGQYIDTAHATMVVNSASLSVHNMTIGVFVFGDDVSTGWQDGLYGTIDTNAIEWLGAGATMWYISHASSTGNIGVATTGGTPPLPPTSFTNMNITGPSGSFDYPTATALQPFPDRLEWPSGLPFAEGQAVVVTFT